MRQDVVPGAAERRQAAIEADRAARQLPGGAAGRARRERAATR
jgi:hypothetical protein